MAISVRTAFPFPGAAVITSVWKRKEKKRILDSARMFILFRARALSLSPFLYLVFGSSPRGKEEYQELIPKVMPPRDKKKEKRKNSSDPVTEKKNVLGEPAH